MFGINKKTLLLAGAYIAGTVITTLFSDKKWKKVREEIEQASWDTKKIKSIIIDNFIETHKNLLDSLKQKVVNEENKKLLNEKISQAKSLVEEYKLEWEKLLEELKEKWASYADTAKEKLEKLYEEKKETISSLNKQAPEKIKEAKNYLLEKFEEVKQKIK